MEIWIIHNDEQNISDSEVVGTYLPLLDDSDSDSESAADKGEDLKDFLNTLAGYLPFPYLTEKILDGSSKLQDIWDTIYEH